MKLALPKKGIRDGPCYDMFPLFQRRDLRWKDRRPDLREVGADVSEAMRSDAEELLSACQEEDFREELIAQTASGIRSVLYIPALSVADDDLITAFDRNYYRRRETAPPTAEELRKQIIHKSLLYELAPSENFGVVVHLQGDEPLPELPFADGENHPLDQRIYSIVYRTQRGRLRRLPARIQKAMILDCVFEAPRGPGMIPVPARCKYFLRQTPWSVDDIAKARDFFTPRRAGKPLAGDYAPLVDAYVWRRSGRGDDAQPKSGAELFYRPLRRVMISEESQDETPPIGTKTVSDHDLPQKGMDAIGDSTAAAEVAAAAAVPTVRYKKRIQLTLAISSAKRQQENLATKEGSIAMSKNKIEEEMSAYGVPKELSDVVELASVVGEAKPVLFMSFPLHCTPEASFTLRVSDFIPLKGEVHLRNWRITDGNAMVSPLVLKMAGEKRSVVPHLLAFESYEGLDGKSDIIWKLVKGIPTEATEKTRQTRESIKRALKKFTPAKAWEKILAKRAQIIAGHAALDKATAKQTVSTSDAKKTTREAEEMAERRAELPAKVQEIARAESEENKKIRADIEKKRTQKKKELEKVKKEVEMAEAAMAKTVDNTPSKDVQMKEAAEPVKKKKKKAQKPKAKESDDNAGIENEEAILASIDDDDFDVTMQDRGTPLVAGKKRKSIDREDAPNPPAPKKKKKKVTGEATQEQDSKKRAQEEAMRLKKEEKERKKKEREEAARLKQEEKERKKKEREEAARLKQEEKERKKKEREEAMQKKKEAAEEKKKAAALKKTLTSTVTENVSESIAKDRAETALQETEAQPVEDSDNKEQQKQEEEKDEPHQVASVEEDDEDFGDEDEDVQMEDVPTPQVVESDEDQGETPIPQDEEGDSEMKDADASTEEETVSTADREVDGDEDEGYINSDEENEFSEDDGIEEIQASDEEKDYEDEEEEDEDEEDDENHDDGTAAAPIAKEEVEEIVGELSPYDRAINRLNGRSKRAIRVFKNKLLSEMEKTRLEISELKEKILIGDGIDSEGIIAAMALDPKIPRGLITMDASVSLDALVGNGTTSDAKQAPQAVEDPLIEQQRNEFSELTERMYDRMRAMDKERRDINIAASTKCGSVEEARNIVKNILPFMCEMPYVGEIVSSRVSAPSFEELCIRAKASARKDGDTAMQKFVKSYNAKAITAAAWAIVAVDLYKENSDGARK